MSDKTHESTITRVETDDRGSDNVNCPRCGTEAKSDGPVTSAGWYGGLRFRWGQVGGVHSCRATDARCYSCDVEWSTHSKWDN